jgi:hypothetical protein
VSKIVRVVSNESANGAAEGFARSKALSLLNSGAINISQVLYLNSARIEINVRGGQAYVRIFDEDVLWAAIASPSRTTGQGFEFGLGKTITSIKKYLTSSLETAIQVGIPPGPSNNPFYMLDAFGDNTYAVSIRHNASTNIFIGSVYGEGKKQQWFAIEWAGGFDSTYNPPNVTKYEEDGRQGVSFFGMNYINSATQWSVVSRIAFRDTMPAEEAPRVLFNWRLGFEDPVDRPRYMELTPSKCFSDTPVGFLINNIDISTLISGTLSKEPLTVFIANAGGGLRTVISLAGVLPAQRNGRYNYQSDGAWYIGANTYAITGRQRVYVDENSYVVRRFVLVFNLDAEAVVVKADTPHPPTGVFDPFAYCVAIGPGAFIVYTGRQFELDPPRVYSNYGLSINPISIFPTVGFEDQFLQCTKFLDPTNPNSQAELYLRAVTFGGEEYKYKGTYVLGDAAIDFTLIEQKPREYNTITFLGKANDKTFSEQLDSLGS